MKAIRFSLNGNAYTAQLGTRVEKKALYGYSRKVAEKSGTILERGYLSADGRLLRRSQMAYIKLDPEGTPVEEVISEIDGKTTELQPSAFERENELAHVPLSRLATFAVSDVYPLEELPLEEGVYETVFSYRKSLQPKEALVLIKGGQAWLLAGASKEAPFLGLDVAYSFFDETEDVSDGDEEPDFSMV